MYWPWDFHSYHETVIRICMGETLWKFTLFFTGSIFFTGVTEIILTGFSSFSLTPVSAASELCSLLKRNKPKLLYLITWIQSLLSHYISKETGGSDWLRRLAKWARLSSVAAAYCPITPSYWFLTLLM